MTEGQTTLLSRIQSATGPDRELDANIWSFIGLDERQRNHAMIWRHQDGRELTERQFILAWAPSFTGSLDAATPRVGLGAMRSSAPPGSRMRRPAWSCSPASIPFSSARVLLSVPNRRAME